MRGNIAIIGIIVVLIFIAAALFVFRGKKLNLATTPTQTTSTVTSTSSPDQDIQSIDTDLNQINQDINNATVPNQDDLSNI